MTVRDYRVDLLAPPSAADAGRVRETLDEAKITTPIEWIRRGIGTMSIAMPVGARRTAAVKPKETEVRVAFKGQPIWWGSVVNEDWDEKSAVFHCEEVPGYLDQRVVGGEGRKNHLSNGSFESGLAGWVKSSTGPAHTIVNVGANAILGSKILRLSNGSTGTPARPGLRAERYVAQVDGVAVGDRKGSRWTARAYFRLRNARIPPYKDRGLRVRLWNGANGNTLREAVFPITDNTVRDKWTEARASLGIPRTIADPRITVYLYCPHDGEIDWDAAGLFYRYAVLEGDTDAVVAFKELVRHAQDGRYGKSPLRLKVVGGQAGHAIGNRFFHDEHANVFQAINSLGVDWWFNPATRSIETYGRGRPVNRDITFEIGRHVGSFTVHRVGTQTVTRVITVAPGSGAERMEGSASRAGRFSGMVYESAVPFNGEVRDLDRRAAAVVDQRAKLVELPDIVTDSTPALIRQLRVGTRHPVILSAGRRRYQGTPRIDRKTLDTDTGKLTIGFTP